ncbi:hypothetical protein LINPERHAP2_LOCUS3577, partial [Linum perenne]
MATHGESSSGSISTSVVSCKHNLVCAINTLGTERNPGRKFWCCRHWKDKSVDCGFFKWGDVRNGRDDDCLADLTTANDSLRKKVDELENALAMTKVKAARRKREQYDLQERVAFMADECLSLVEGIRQNHNVLC